MLTVEIINQVREATGGSEIAELCLTDLHVQVRILDAKAAYGRIDVLVTPVSGHGERWAKLENIKKLKEITP